MPPVAVQEDVIALNPDRIGHVYPSYRYEVSREKIREYALATGVDDPRCTADPADLALHEVVAPPTFAAAFTLGRTDALTADPELGWHWNLVHGSQAYTWHRPIRGGDVYDCTPRIVDIVDRGRMELLTYAVDCADAATGEPVVSARSVIIFFAPSQDAG